MFWNRWFKWMSHDMAIDLGTANTLVYVRGRGIVRQPGPRLIVEDEVDPGLAPPGLCGRDLLGERSGGRGLVHALPRVLTCRPAGIKPAGMPIPQPGRRQ